MFLLCNLNQSVSEEKEEEKFDNDEEEEFKQLRGRRERKGENEMQEEQHLIVKARTSGQSKMNHLHFYFVLPYLYRYGASNIIFYLLPNYYSIKVVDTLNHNYVSPNNLHNTYTQLSRMMKQCYI